MQVFTRNPQFRIRFVTQTLGEFTFDMTHSSAIEITTTKKMGDTAGGFTLKFVPRPLSNIRNAGQWQDVLEPMDFVEIYAWVPPRKPERPLMRGFIDTVREDFDIASGTPDKWITIAG